jgi:hypothetical protein
MAYVYLYIDQHTHLVRYAGSSGGDVKDRHRAVKNPILLEDELRRCVIRTVVIATETKESAQVLEVALIRSLAKAGHPLLNERDNPNKSGVKRLLGKPFTNYRKSDKFYKSGLKG